MRPAKLGRLLAADPGLQPLVAKALEIGALARQCAEFLPPEIARQTRAANLKDGRLVILAATSAAAAKLRLLAEGLCKFLSQQGAKVNAVSVRVQPEALARPPEGAPARALPPEGARALRALHARLRDSPARRALKALLDHEFKPRPGEPGRRRSAARPRRARR